MALRTQIIFECALKRTPKRVHPWVHDSDLSAWLRFECMRSIKNLSAHSSALQKNNTHKVLRTNYYYFNFSDHTSPKNHLALLLCIEDRNSCNTNQSRRERERASTSWAEGVQPAAVEVVGLLLPHAPDLNRPHPQRQWKINNQLSTWRHLDSPVKSDPLLP